MFDLERIADLLVIYGTRALGDQIRQGPVGS
jgi:hypothetical protein